MLLEFGAVAESSDLVKSFERLRSRVANIVDVELTVEERDVLDGLGEKVRNTVSRIHMEILTILPTVRVPVLSVQKTDMQPSVSTVARFFTRTLCLDMRFAMMVSDKATQTGRP